MTDAEALAILDEAAQYKTLRIQLATRHVRERLTAGAPVASFPALPIDPEAERIVEAASAHATAIVNTPRVICRCTDPACSCGHKETP